MKNSYIHLSTFLLKKKRDGGVRRSCQISENIASYKIDTVFIAEDYRQLARVTYRCPLTFISSFLISLRYYANFGLTLSGMIRFAFFLAEVRHILLRYPSQGIILETAFGSTILLMRYLTEIGKEYSVFSHNIEFCTPIPMSELRKYFCSSKQLRQNEIFGYKNAERVYVISEVDKQILEKESVGSFIAPYYPCSHDKKWLSRTYHLRKKTKQKKEFFLMFGSAANPPTLAGLKQAIHAMSLLDIQVKIAGFGTECLAQYCSDNIQMLGTQSDLEMQWLLVNCKALIVNQPNTSGFVTKLVDINLCGVPQIVISEYVQARGLEEYGIYIRDLFNIKHLLLEDNFKKFSKISLRIF